MHPKHIEELATEAAQSIEPVENPFTIGTDEYNHWLSVYTQELDECYENPSFYFNEDKNIRNLDYYLTRAKEIGLNTQSGRKLSEALGLAPNAVHGWESGKSFPSDETMIKIANLAMLPKEQALLELLYWKTNDEETKVTYEAILKRVVNSAKVLIAFFGLLLLSTPAHATSLVLVSSSSIFTTVLAGIYIIKLLQEDLSDG